MPGPPGVVRIDQHDHRLRVHRRCPSPGRVLTVSPGAETLMVISRRPRRLGLDRHPIQRGSTILARPRVTSLISAAQWVLVPPLTDEDTPLDFLVFLAILAGAMGIYYVSLRLNPWVECSKCHGQPRPRGWFFGYAHHFCSKCEGTGHQLRFGRRLFGMGPPADGG
jgi:hypothetical protein